jgi:hypothetical protein
MTVPDVDKRYSILMFTVKTFKAEYVSIIISPHYFMFEIFYNCNL